MSAHAKTLACLAIAAAVIGDPLLAADPDCTSPDAWPAGSAFAHLKDAGLVNNEQLDFKKTTVSRIASEKIGRDLYRQVHLVSFQKNSGERVDAITVNNASREECSMSEVEVYVVSIHLGRPN